MLGNLVAAVYLTLYGVLFWPVPTWAVALPLITFIVWTVTSKTYDCPLTKLEDAVRARYRQPLVKAFLAYFVVKPYRRWRKMEEDS